MQTIHHLDAWTLAAQASEPEKAPAKQPPRKLTAREIIAIIDAGGNPPGS
jgi:hypothetical protein